MPVDSSAVVISIVGNSNESNLILNSSSSNVNDENSLDRAFKDSTNAHLEVLDLSVNGLKQSVSTLNTSVSGLNTSVSGLNTSVSGLNTSVSDLSTNLALNKVSIAAINTKFTDLLEVINDADDDIALLNDTERAKLFVKICCKYVAFYIIPYFEMYNNPKLQKMYSQEGFRQPVADYNFREEQKILGTYLLKYFGETAIDQTLLSSEVLSEYQCSLKIAQTMVLSSQSLQTLDFGGIIGARFPGSLYRSPDGNDHDIDRTNKMSKAISAYPVTSKNQEMILINVIESVIENLNYNLEQYKYYVTKGLRPHVIEWYPETYCAVPGGTGKLIGDISLNLQPKYATVAPTDISYAYWEPYNGRVENSNLWASTKPTEAVKVKTIYTNLKDVSNLFITYKSLYVDARNRLKTACDSCADYFVSSQFKALMIYDNKPGYYSQVKRMTELTDINSLKIISDSLNNAALLTQTSYYDTDPVWTVQKKTNVTDISLGFSDASNVNIIFDNFNFIQDTTARPISEKLYDLGVGTNQLYVDVMDFLIRKIKADPSLVLLHPDFSGNKTNNELLQYVASKNRDIRSELDVYGVSGFTSIPYFADGHKLYEYNLSDWNNYDRDPSFAIRTISSASDISQNPNLKYYPVWTPKLPFQYVRSDHYNASGISNIITMASDYWLSYAPKLVYQEELAPVNAFGNMLRPTKASFLANVLVASNTTLSKMWHETAGYYVGRMWQNYNVFKYKKYIQNELNAKFLDASGKDYYKNSKYICATGVYAGYGVAEGITITYNGNKYNGIYETMQTQFIQYNNGALLGVGCLHEWLSGHSIVLPIQLTIKNELIAKNKLSLIRRFENLGVHMEGFTNLIELNAILLGPYNKIIDISADGVTLSPTKLDYFLALGAIQAASRIGVRLSADIALHFSKYDLTWNQTLDLWYNAIGAPNISIMTRQIGVGWIQQNANYCPAAMFLKGAELKYKQQLGVKFDLAEFFRVAVLDNIQPNTVEFANVSLKKWADARALLP